MQALENVIKGQQNLLESQQKFMQQQAARLDELLSRFWSPHCSSTSFMLHLELRACLEDWLRNLKLRALLRQSIKLFAAPQFAMEPAIIILKFAIRSPMGPHGPIGPAGRSRGRPQPPGGLPFLAVLYVAGPT